MNKRNIPAFIKLMGFPGGSVSKESTWNAGDCLQCRRPGFDSLVGKIPWRRNRLLSIGSTRIEHNLVTKPQKAYNHREKKDMNNTQNLQVDVAMFWILVNVMAERKEQLGVWASGEEQVWFSVRLLWVDPMRRWDLSQVLKKIWELEKFLGSKKILL